MEIVCVTECSMKSDKGSNNELEHKTFDINQY